MATDSYVSPPSVDDLLAENLNLRNRLHDAQERLWAMQSVLLTIGTACVHGGVIVTQGIMGDRSLSSVPTPQAPIDADK